MSSAMIPPTPLAWHMANAKRASLTVPTQSVGLWLSRPSIFRSIVRFSGMSNRLASIHAATVSAGSHAT